MQFEDCPSCLVNRSLWSRAELWCVENFGPYFVFDGREHIQRGLWGRWRDRFCFASEETADIFKKQFLGLLIETSNHLHSEKEAWCNENIIGEVYIAPFDGRWTNNIFWWFSNPHDAAMFKLRWG